MWNKPRLETSIKITARAGGQTGFPHVAFSNCEQTWFIPLKHAPTGDNVSYFSHIWMGRERGAIRKQDNYEE
jgi:hypothetical protein